MDVHPPNKWYFHRYWSIAILIFSVLSCIKLPLNQCEHRPSDTGSTGSGIAEAVLFTPQCQPSSWQASEKLKRSLWPNSFPKIKDVASLETNCGNMVAPRLYWLMFPIYESWQSTFLPWNPVVKAKHVWSCQKMMRIVGYICCQT